MARDPVFQLTTVALVVGLMLACAGGSRAATQTNDARDSWTWESSAGVGMAWASPVNDVLCMSAEARYGRRASEHLSFGLSAGVTRLRDPSFSILCAGGCDNYPPVVKAVTVVPVMGLVKVHLPTGRNAEPYVAVGGGIAWYHARSRWPDAENLDEFYPELCALAGITGRRRVSPRVELRYDCHRGLDPGLYYTVEDHWYQQVSLTIGINVRSARPRPVSVPGTSIPPAGYDDGGSSLPLGAGSERNGR